MGNFKKIWFREMQVLCALQVLQSLKGDSHEFWGQNQSVERLNVDPFSKKLQHHDFAPLTRVPWE